jgi:hypothetical protein
VLSIISITEFNSTIILLNSLSDTINIWVRYSLIWISSYPPRVCFVLTFHILIPFLLKIDLFVRRILRWIIFVTRDKHTCPSYRLLV